MKIIIAGAYAIGTHLAMLLSRNDQDVVLIDEDEERLGNISSDYDLMTLHASPTSIKTLKDAGAGNADLYIGVTPDENMNMNSCILAKALGVKKTVAKVNNYEFINPNLDEFFTKVGIDSIVYPENLAAHDIVNGLKMSWVRQRWDVHNGALIMLGIKLRETCEILNEPLKDLCKPESPYHIVAVKRGEDTIIPRGDDVLKVYDMAYFLTTRNYIPYIRKIVGKEHYVDVKNVMVMGGGNTAIRAVQMMPEYMGAKIIEADEKRCEQINELIDIFTCNSRNHKNIIRILTELFGKFRLTLIINSINFIQRDNLIQISKFLRMESKFIINNLEIFQRIFSRNIYKMNQKSAAFNVPQKIMS